MYCLIKKSFKIQLFHFMTNCHHKPNKQARGYLSLSLIMMMDSFSFSSHQLQKKIEELEFYQKKSGTKGALNSISHLQYHAASKASENFKINKGFY